MIRIGIIGTGGMGNTHANEFKKNPRVKLASCYDIEAERAREFAQRHGIAHVAQNLGDLLEQVDAVSVVTPDRFHAGPTIAALQAGKHVLCEKPLTTTLAEARRVTGAARVAHRKAGVMHMINFSYRHSPAFQEALKMVARGELGEIRHVHSRYLQSWLVSTAWGHWSSPSFLWRLQTSRGSGGVLGDIGCHILDFTTAVAGDLDAVHCTLRTFAKIDARGRKHTRWQGVPLDANDSAVIELSFANGALGICQMSRWATGRANTVALEVHGTEGALSINLDDGGWDKLHTCRGDDVHRHAWTTRPIKQTPTNYERFIRAIETGRPEQPDILRGGQVQAYLDACTRSAASGKAIQIRPGA